MTEPIFATERRAPLTKERVLRAAVDLADREGIEALSMRRLGQELGVEAMALYRHVRNKDDLLEGLVEAVVGGDRASLPVGGLEGLRCAALVMSSRQVMLSHPWAPRVIIERPTVGPATLRHIDAVLGILSRRRLRDRHGPPCVARPRQPDPRLYPGPVQRHGGHATRTRRRGHASPASSRRSSRTSGSWRSRPSHEGALGGCDDDVEFAFGLDLILEGLDRRRAS